MRQSPIEAEDQKLVEEIIFNPNHLDLQKIPRSSKLTADFQVTLNGSVVAYCELKSPHDDWLDKLLDLADPFQIVGGWREDPIFKKIRKHANKASKQFEACNPTRNVPDILLFVNHDDGSDFSDLMETFTGQFHADDGSRHATMSDIASSLERAKSQIDLCIWVDGKSRRVQGFYMNEGTSPNYLNQLCILFGKNPLDIKH